jgi:hypothetical protein
MSKNPYAIAYGNALLIFDSIGCCRRNRLAKHYETCGGGESSVKYGLM